MVDSGSVMNMAPSSTVSTGTGSSPRLSNPQTHSFLSVRGSRSIYLRYPMLLNFSTKVTIIRPLTVSSFASNNPPVYNQSQSPDPVDPTSGRSNNQGFEGLTVSGDGRNLYALLQSAAVQEGGLSKLTNRYARMVKYDISGSGGARLAREYVVPLPQFNDVSTPLKSPLPIKP